MFRFCGLFDCDVDPADAAEDQEITSFCGLTDAPLSLSEAEKSTIAQKFGPAHRMMLNADGSQTDIGWLQDEQKLLEHQSEYIGFGLSKLNFTHQGPSRNEDDHRFPPKPAPRAMSR